MKLSRLYSNVPEIFAPIQFQPGLNVVLGEIHQPQDRSEDTHNLGKTLLAELIDFCLLRKKRRDLFLFEHQDKFSRFVFFLEVRLHHGGFVTIRRSVDQGSKASFLRHSKPGQDFTDLKNEDWDHWLVSFEASKALLDGILDLQAISPWSFRHAIAYSLRSQGDYDEPFKLAKFAGKHGEWKPLLAHILGLNSELVSRNYELLQEIRGTEERLSTQRAEAAGLEDLDRLRGLIAIREQEIERHQERLDSYDFSLADAEINKELVEELGGKIADLNERRYYLSAAINRTRAALEERVDFDLDQVRKIFAESQVYFESSLRKDYESLIEFNRAIAEERDTYLSAELGELQNDLRQVEESLGRFNARQAAALVTLRDREAFSKYRDLSQRLVKRKADLETLRRQEDALAQLAATKRKLHEQERELAAVREGIEANIEEGSDRYRDIRAEYNKIVAFVINQNANIYIAPNDEGNPGFHADLIDEQGHTTSAGRGHTYGRLLCIAFDMAVQHAYRQDPFPHFLYHDGALESLDDRKKLNLIDIIRSRTEAGLQHIITVIDSELPLLGSEERFGFGREEVICRLHDEGFMGRLFKMPTW